MNIYEKLQQVRVSLQEKKLKKSGKNSYSGYDYYELSDILPEINRLMNEHKMTSVVSFDTDYARLRLIDSEKPEEKIEFTSPMSTASLKGCHDVQNLGAVETYERRYLYMTAFEIVESDVLDKTHDKTKAVEKTKQQRLAEIAKENGVDLKEIAGYIKLQFAKTTANDLSDKEFDEVKHYCIYGLE